MSENKNIRKHPVVTKHPSSLNHSNSNNIENISIWSKLVQLWPMTIATCLSIGWIIYCFYVAQYSKLVFIDLPISEFSSLLSGVMLPLIMLWLLCLVLIRIDPAKEKRKIITDGLDELLKPLDITQNRITNIVTQLNTEIKNVEEAAELASNKIEKLENVFKEQISDLFKVTIDIDSKANSIKNELTSEKNEISTLVKDIEDYTNKISSQFKQFKSDAENINVLVQKQSESFSNEMNFQNDVFLDRSKNIEETLGTLGGRLSEITTEISDQTDHSYHNLSEVIEGFDERKAVLNSFMTSMMDEVAIICEKLESQAIIISELASKSASDSEHITLHLKDQAKELSTISELAIKDVNATGQAIADQAKSMEFSIKEATEQSKLNIAEVSDHFSEKANELNRISTDIGVNINQYFSDITDSITGKAQFLEQNVAQQFTTIEEDIDKRNSDIVRMVIENVGSLKTVFDQNKVQTEGFLNDVLTSINSQSEQLEKSLSDTRINMIDKTTLLQDEYQTLEKFAQKFQDRIETAENNFKVQNKNMLDCIKVIEESLETAANKIKTNSTSLGSHGQKIIEHIISQTSELSEQIAEIQKRSKQSIVEIQNASMQANENMIINGKHTSEIFEEWRTASNDIEDKFSMNIKHIEELAHKLANLDQGAEKIITSSEENIKRISKDIHYTSDKIHVASTSAVEAAEETNKALSKNADQYQQMINAIQLSSQSLSTNAYAIEKKLKELNHNHFADIATKVLSDLQSLSVDMTRYLDEEIPQKYWDNYIAGDKNLFIREIKKYIGQNTINSISNKYKTDTDFRKLADEYMRTFEQLLSTLSEKSIQSIYKMTVVSSDTGKVYFALAEATGRLKS
jgi:DNA repair exonuclease SbcCD ATPase subunit